MSLIRRCNILRLQYSVLYGTTLSHAVRLSREKTETADGTLAKEHIKCSYLLKTQTTWIVKQLNTSFFLAYSWWLINIMGKKNDAILRYLNQRRDLKNAMSFLFPVLKIKWKDNRVSHIQPLFTYLTYTRRYRDVALPWWHQNWIIQYQILYHRYYIRTHRHYIIFACYIEMSRHARLTK